MAFRFSELQQLYLFEAYLKTMASGGEYTFDPDTVNLIESLGTAVPMARKCSNSLVEKGFLNRSENDPLRFEITGAGMENIEAQLDELTDQPQPGTPLGIAFEKAEDYRQQMTDSVSAWGRENSGETRWDSEKQDVPASDRMVSRTDNLNTWDESVKLLDNVIAEFKLDHKFGNELAREKNALILVLEAGRDLLNDEVINIQLGVTLILEPLKIVKTRVEKYLAEHPGVTDGLTVVMITDVITAFSKLLFGA